MNEILERWNELGAAAAAEEILPCCGSRAWAAEMARRRPMTTLTVVSQNSDAAWHSLAEEDWTEALRSHPRIGERHAVATPQSLMWSAQEQGASLEGESVATQLAEANRRYEELFGQTFIICASGKSAAEILETLRLRMRNSPSTEILEAAEQQRQITRLRLAKWLQQEPG